MAKPIKPTPVLTGKAAECFIKKLEAEKNIPVYPSEKNSGYGSPSRNCCQH